MLWILAACVAAGIALAGLVPVAAFALVSVVVTGFALASLPLGGAALVFVCLQAAYVAGLALKAARSARPRDGLPGRPEMDARVPAETREP